MNVFFILMLVLRLGRVDVNTRVKIARWRGWAVAVVPFCSLSSRHHRVSMRDIESKDYGVLVVAYFLGCLVVYIFVSLS